MMRNDEADGDVYGIIGREGHLDFWPINGCTNLTIIKPMMSAPIQTNALMSWLKIDVMSKKPETIMGDALLIYSNDAATVGSMLSIAKKM